MCYCCTCYFWILLDIFCGVLWKFILWNYYFFTTKAHLLMLSVLCCKAFTACLFRCLYILIRCESNGIKKVHLLPRDGQTFRTLYFRGVSWIPDIHTHSFCTLCFFSFFEKKTLNHLQILVFVRIFASKIHLLARKVWICIWIF